jgi:hypothetical protein
VKVTLVGRPAQIEERDTYVAATLESRRIPDLPKGLPAPPQAPTRYTVFIVKKQWERVKGPLAKEASDSLIVEGFARFDAALGAVVVYATNATTVSVQRALKESQRTSQQIKPTPS